MNQRNSWKKLALALALVLALIAGATRPASAFLDKTRFIAHLGVAYFVFHHWILGPYDQGAFAAGAPHRTAALVKGGVALLFAVHEVHVAEKIAAHSKDPLLQKLNAGVVALAGTFVSVAERMKAGQFSTADLGQLQNTTGTLQSAAQQNGVTIKDVPAPIPGT
jgi:hypothetical protein